MYEHDNIWLNWADEGVVTPTTAPTLYEMKDQFVRRGLLDRFEKYLSIEQTVWNQLEEELHTIESDETSYQDDEHYPADWYRERAKYRAEEEADKRAAQWRQEELSGIGVDVEDISG